ncbi:MAG: hypothetical protein LBL45_03485 [Treponema sp.]|nr:hypothetical protein [Treponema sp.]
MKLEIHCAGHPDDVKRYDMGALREHFLFEKTFVERETSLYYTHSDRVVFGWENPAA